VLRARFRRGRQPAACPFLSGLERGPDNTYDFNCGIGGGEAVLTHLGKKRGLAAQMAVEKFREPDYEPAPVVINAGSY
jgi:hypothetical protein